MSQNALDIYNIGYYYYTGTGGYPLNHSKAFEYFKKAAELGVGAAMNYLGVIYEAGKVVPQDYQMAANWFFKAIQANNNDIYAAYNLSRMYFDGTGVEKNMEKAYEYARTTVKLGSNDKQFPYPRSCYLVGCILLNYYNNPQEAYPYFIDAAKYGNIPEAFHNLGFLAEKGVLPLRDPGSNPNAARDGLARSFYEDAADLGYAPSMASVARLHLKYNMTEEALPYLRKAAAMGYEPAKKSLKLISISQSNSVWDLLRNL